MLELVLAVQLPEENVAEVSPVLRVKNAPLNVDTRRTRD